MQPGLLKDLQSRLLAGDALSVAEQETLLRQLEQDPREQEAFFADEGMDTLLRSLAHLPATQEAFVQATLSRAKQLGAEARFRAEPSPAAGARPSVPSPLRFSLGRFSWSASRRILAAAGIAATLWIGLSVWWLFGQRRDLAPPAQPPVARDEPTDRLSTPPPVPGHAREGFATVVKVDAAAWDAPLAEGSRLAGEARNLLRGAAEIHLDNGTVARLTAPAAFELRSANELFLRRGCVVAHVPASAAGFMVSTPVSRVVDLGTQFEVRVDELGATETVVRQGRVRLQPRREGEPPGKALELVAGAFDRASISLPDMESPVLPLTTMVQGQAGFIGLISVEGKTVEFHSADAFREFRESVYKQLRESPVRFRQQWSMSVHTSGASAEAAAWVEIDGQRHAVEIPEELPGSPAPDRGRPQSKGVPDAKQLLRQQLEESRRQNSDNPAMQKMLDGMLQNLDDL